MYHHLKSSLNALLYSLPTQQDSLVTEVIFTFFTSLSVTKGKFMELFILFIFVSMYSGYGFFIEALLSFCSLFYQTNNLEINLYHNIIWNCMDQNYAKLYSIRNIEQCPNRKADLMSK